MSRIGDSDLIKLLDRHYGTKEVVLYYIRKARTAAGKAKVAIASQNQHELGAAAQDMIRAIDMLDKTLGDEKKIDRDKNKQ